MSQQPVPQAQQETTTQVIKMFVKARKEDSKIVWDLDDKDPPSKGKKKITLAPDSGEHLIVFHLVAAQGLKIDFNQSDPIWVVEGGTCPPPTNSKSDQIDVIECKKNKLEITNFNEGKPRRLTYQLNFIGAEPCDPVIENGGGNH